MISEFLFPLFPVPFSLIASKIARFVKLKAGAEISRSHWKNSLCGNKKGVYILTNIEKLYQSIESEKQRSAWDKGVTQYALELVEQLGEQINGGYFEELDLTESKKVRAALLNGAADWSQYSWGGCSLIYDGDIAERLCCPSELKKTRNGERRPNSREEWLDVQARALYQAANRICRHIRTLEKSGYILYEIPMF